MFTGAQNFVIEDGIFMNIDASKEVDIGRLIEYVAPNAILNVGGRTDEVGCYPGTRKEVIGKLENWMSGFKNSSCENRVMWLSGPAGAGKSAICQTVAERCRSLGQQAANFFFFRDDKTRNHAQPLVSTVVYQLRRFYPMLDELLTNCLMADPLICKASIEDQFLSLISSPVQMFHQSSSAHETCVLISDGLDECDDTRKQDQILLSLHTLANMDHSPFLVLIASRAEPHLIMSFNRFGESIGSIFLNDDEYNPQDDIRHFVTAKFEEIKQVHHLRQMLQKDWPPKSDIDTITNKSSGQFLYAAAVMRFIQHSAESPNLSLAAILGMQPSAGHNPLAQLDAVYSHVFSRVQNIQKVKLILCISLIINLEWPNAGWISQDILQLLGYGPAEVASTFAYLGAIIKVETNPVKLVFYHAPLHDYLKDKSRSGDYHLNMGEIAAEVSAICLRHFHDKRSFSLAILPLRFVDKATAELSRSLLDASMCTFSLTKAQKSEWVYNWSTFVLQIERLYFKTDRELFKNLLRGWVRFAYLNSFLQDIKLDTKMLNLSASLYYRWCRFTQGHKFALNNN